MRPPGSGGILTCQLSSMPFWSLQGPRIPLSRSLSRVPRPCAFWTLALAVQLSAGCRHAKVPDGVSIQPVTGSVSIVIVNRNALDATLYVVHDGFRERLGTVTAATQSSFELPFARLGAGREFYLVADPIGGKQPARTETLQGLDGLVITWTLESDLRRSSVTTH
jgi:hypothetical protein